MTTLTYFVCILLVAIEIIFVPLYLKKMWPTKNWHSLGYKMICATSYLALALTLVISKGGFNRFSAMMLAGFVCSWFGDLNLHIPKPTKKFFLLGTFFFMAAHIFYCLGYINIQRSLFSSVPTFLWWELTIAAVFIIVFFTVCLIKKIQFGAMIIPCAVYSVFVTIMMIKSTELGIRMLLSHSSPALPAILLLVGGICFLLSDGSLALISFDTRYKKFKLKVFNIVTYFLAQLCLAFTIFYFS